ncbi:hypothetical protein [Ferruginibacter sp. SUN106]|uniref:hypothetical protein n=1 Tax=Ferruginibacter sp. SUN106 TaxID=2978348 RepID=UPI003D36008B
MSDKSKYIVFLVCGGLCSFVMKDHGKYYLKNRWYTSSSPYFALKARPKKVIEYFYSRTDSLLKSDIKKFGSWEECIYDTAGNPEYRKLFFDDNYWSSYTYQYSPSGYKTLSEKMSKGVITKGVFTTFEAAGNGTFKQKVMYESNTTGNILYRSKNNGNEIFTEETRQNGNNKLGINTYSQYNGEQLISRVISNIMGRDTVIEKEKYFYGKENAIDSIITVSKLQSQRDYFFKNESGDPHTEITIKNNDTTSYNTYTYIYDDKGNWIRRLGKNHLLNPDHYVKNIQYNLIIREITY